MQIPMKVRLGELIVQEGSMSEDMYFLVSGTVIAVRQGFPIMEMHHGDFFGELGCLLGSQRSSSVYALSDCELYTLSADALKMLNRKFPSVVDDLKRIAKHRRSRAEQMQKHKKVREGEGEGVEKGGVESIYSNRSNARARNHNAGHCQRHRHGVPPARALHRWDRQALGLGPAVA